VETSASVASMNAVLKRSGTAKKAELGVGRLDQNHGASEHDKFRDEINQSQSKCRQGRVRRQADREKDVASSAIRTSCLMEAPHSRSAFSRTRCKLVAITSSVPMYSAA